ncbi:MAG: hypothetical protein DRJ98_08030 [Thermoprotei archaeon]|nr:MAG: hypothetical protein DRJ98_08030 [Thermoprotei archaeon]
MRWKFVEALEYLMLSIALTSLVFTSIALSYSQLRVSRAPLNYLELHLVFEGIIVRPDSTVRISLYLPPGTILRFQGDTVHVEGAVIESSLVLKYDLYGIVIEASETQVRYTSTFNSLELRGRLRLQPPSTLQTLKNRNNSSRV